MSVTPRPGHTPLALRLAEHLFGPRVARLTFEPLVADWRTEVDEAHTRWAAARARVRGSLTWLSTAAWCTSAAMSFSGMAAPIGVTVLFAIVGTALLALPFVVVNLVRLPAALVPLILPSLAAVAIPVAMLPAALRLGASSFADEDERALARLRVATLAAVLVPLLLAGTGWLVPAANQAWRVEIAAMRGRSAPPRALRELRLPELARADAVAAYGDAARSERRKRVLIPLLWPPLLAMLGWHLGRHRRRAGLLAMTGYWLVPALTLVVVSYAPGAGFVFESPDLACAVVWLLMIGALRVAPRPTAGASLP